MEPSKRFLPYGRHAVDDDDVAAVVAVLRGDWLTTGPTVEAFEAAFADKVGARFAVSCSSGTAGLHLATLALEFGADDDIVVPSMTFLATANAARYVGAEVTFADVDEDSGLLGVDHLRAALARAGNRARGVIPVSPQWPDGRHGGGRVDRRRTRFARDRGRLPCAGRPDADGRRRDGPGRQLPLQRHGGVLAPPGQDGDDGRRWRGDDQR